METSSPETFESVFARELEEVAKRQGKQTADEVNRKELAGIALSGGGIRSATTSLGVLQALKNLGLLHVFDYLSTVSGGGFTGSWWSAWTSRHFDGNTNQEYKFFPPPELTQPERDVRHASPTTKPKERNDRILDPVHHVRLFSNYLTPMKGLLSSDTWRANTVVTRNLLLTWLVLLPMLFAAVLLAQVYFTIQPNAEIEFLYPYSHMAEDDALLGQLAFGITVTSRLDSIVHGSNAVSELAPIRELRKINEPPSLKKIGGEKDPLLALTWEIDSLRRSDSATLQHIGNLTALPVLRSELETAEQGMLAWHHSDSGIKAFDRTNAKERNADYGIALQKNNISYERLLDPEVDSIRSYIARLQDEMIAHRVNTRESWLFNNTHLHYLANRAVWASYLPIMMLAWIVMLICLWMINSSDKLFGGNILQGSYAFICGLIAFNLLNWLIPTMLDVPDLYSETLMTQSLLELGWSVVALIVLNRVLWNDAHWFWKAHHKSMTQEANQELAKLLEIRRARIVTHHQRLLLATFIAIVLLGFGGFGHELINYLFLYQPNESTDFWQWVARFAGIAAIATALMGTGFAARNAAPNADRGEMKSNKVKDIFVALAPPIILLLLMCGVSWASHWILQDLVFRGGQTKQHHYIILVFSMWMFGFLSLYYAVYDLHFRRRKQTKAIPTKQFSRTLFTAIILVQTAIMIAALIQPSFRFKFSIFWSALPIITWIVIAWKYKLEQKGYRSVEKVVSSAENPNTALPTAPAAKRRSMLSGGLSAFLILAFSTILLVVVASFVEIAQLPIDHLFLVALGASVALLLMELVWGVRSPEEGRRGNHEARILLGINITMYSLFLIIPSLQLSPHWGITHILEILIAVSLGLVIFVGWRVDPNALSIHAFYKQRIVRAYLGASNALRHHASVSEVHPEDDIPLSKLTNCDRGAPYHLINTTLNLLGTKSLETAQRNASNFILSKCYCGSVTTGYRPTEEYMSSMMTLGTAVAISGAAASPTMGSARVSGATTMLMSLLNVRLGFWAANPNKMRWRESQPKLWPYYLLRESLSQTSGFGAFCYLTDGGHFDNTGLYPLIERGCRYIVLCDNGADPNAHFKDLGNALRRCRIDFGVEFELDGLKEMTSMGRHSGGSHWLRGTIRYSEEHVRTLWGREWDKGLSEKERNNYLNGTILILKPVLLGDEPADVLQYGLANADFPQQSTANQWFSEDQFESYRRLGYWSAQTAFVESDYSGYNRSEQLQAIENPPQQKSTTPLQKSVDLAYGAPAPKVPEITIP